jgi:hypothetical protein
MPEDLEMNRMEPTAAGKRDELPDREIDTEYKSIDWKKIFLSPKYIRMRTLPCLEHVYASNSSQHGTFSALVF